MALETLVGCSVEFRIWGEVFCVLKAANVFFENFENN
jgi:hypothetical protein